MTTARQISDYLRETEELPADVLLGHVCYYTVTQESSTTVETLTRLFAECDLEDRFIPTPTRPVDAFREATGPSVRHHYTLQDDRRRTIFIRDVADTDQKFTRHLIREIRDSRNEVLQHETVGEMSFYKPTKNGDGSERVLARMVAGLPGPEEQEVKTFLQQLTQRYAASKRNVGPQRLRAMIRDYLRWLNAFALKRGVYFVHQSRAADLEALRQMLAAIGIKLNTIPLVDFAEQREAVIDAFHAELGQEYTDLVKECAATLDTPSGRRITASRYATLRRRLAELDSRRAEHERVLRTSLNSADGAKDMAEIMVANVQAAFLAQ